MATITVDTIASLTRIPMTFSASVDLDTVDGAGDWTLVNPTSVLAASVVVIGVEPDVDGDQATGATLIVHPEMTPGATYTVSASGLDAATATPPTSLAPSDLSEELGPIECLTLVFGRQMQDIGGAPSTVLLVDLVWGDDTAVVETTNAFPDASSAKPQALLVGGHVFGYASRLDGAFGGLSWPDELAFGVPAGTEVSFNARVRL